MRYLTIVVILTLLFSTKIGAQEIIIKQNNSTMKVAVWDTYVTKKNGNVMHFDIIVPQELKDNEVIFNFGKEYLKTKEQEGQPLTSKECRFCHIEKASQQMVDAINKKGYYIIEMENCN